MKQWGRWCAALAALVALAFAAGLHGAGESAPVSAGSVLARTIVIDAGHGGEDGGAVSLTGISESQINLEISCKLEDILALYGIQAQMLRREDISLHDQSAQTIRAKKVSDLKNRVSRVEDTQNALLVSVHQNSYPDPSCRGTQVFHTGDDLSKELSRHIQDTFNTALDPQRPRTVKQIPDTIYLMKHVTCPAVLIECGFLSNPAEEALLRSDQYQQKVAACIAGALLTMEETTKEIL